MKMRRKKELPSRIQHQVDSLKVTIRVQARQSIINPKNSMEEHVADCETESQKILLSTSKCQFDTMFARCEKN